jgi:uncharacterized protein (TIGR02300 family)
MAIAIPFARSDLWRGRVAKPDWGTKRVCLSCGAKFYDLNRESIVCPSCGTPYDATVSAKPRRSRAARPAPVAAEEVERVPPVEAENDEEEEEVTVEVEDEGGASDEDGEEDDEEEADSAIEDVSELSDDDMTDVIDTEIDEEEGER